MTGPHDHCPNRCDHPQPGDYAGTGRRICGNCWFHSGIEVEVVPCTPEVCA